MRAVRGITAAVVCLAVLPPPVLFGSSSRVGTVHATSDAQRGQAFAYLLPRHHDPRRPGAYWDPCRNRITYGIDFRAAARRGMNPNWERHRWRSAFQELGSQVRQTIRYAGSIRTRAVGGRPRTAADVDIVITYGTSRSRGAHGYGRQLDGGAAGIGGAYWFPGRLRHRAEIRSGFIVIDAAQVAGDTDFSAKSPAVGRPGIDALRTLYMHEAGHALGLDHVADPDQLMYPRLNARTPDRLGPGDRAGLRRMASQACL